MANMPAFILRIQNKVSQAQFFTDEGFAPEAVYKQYLPQVKQPIYPCISLAYEIDKRELFADIDNGKLYAGVHCKEFNQAERIGHQLSDLIHQSLYSGDDCIVYFARYVGGPPTPIFNTMLNCWETICEFEVRIG